MTDVTKIEQTALQFATAALDHNKDKLKQVKVFFSKPVIHSHGFGSRYYSELRIVFTSDKKLILPIELPLFVNEKLQGEVSEVTRIIEEEIDSRLD